MWEEESEKHRLEGLFSKARENSCVTSARLYPGRGEMIGRRLKTLEGKESSLGIQGRHNTLRLVKSASQSFDLLISSYSLIRFIMKNGKH